jgi:hypothetical protein
MKYIALIALLFLVSPINVEAKAPTETAKVWVVQQTTEGNYRYQAQVLTLKVENTTTKVITKVNLKLDLIAERNVNYKVTKLVKKLKPGESGTISLVFDRVGAARQVNYHVKEVTLVHKKGPATKIPVNIKGSFVGKR